MLIINTLTILLQVAFIVFMSLLSMNIIKQFSSSARKMAVAPAVFVNHGGGPMPLMGDKGSQPLTKFLRDDLQKHINLKEIKAIVLVTAHWEEKTVTISSSTHHNLFFDYYGFPPETYEYEYPAPGDPELAKRIQDVLKSNGINSKLDPERGWDHGVFVPMLLINPAADIPIVQVSVLKSQDAEEHYRIGEALHELRKDGIAIIGSGMSYHNMREFMYGRDGHQVVNEEFDEYLNKICTKDGDRRREGFIDWRNQPGALQAHPLNRAEHLMPLIVVAGAGGSAPGRRIFNWDMSDTFRLSGFLWPQL